MNDEPMIPTPEPENAGWQGEPAGAETVQDPAGEGTSDSWKEVGRQFQALGESLAAAFQASVKNERTRAQLDEMRNGLDAMVQEVGQAIKSTTSSQPVEKARTEVTKATETLVARGEQAVQEARPHILNALRVVNAELQKLIDRMQTGSQHRHAAQQPPAPTRIEIEPSEDETNPIDPSI